MSVAEIELGAAELVYGRKQVLKVRYLGFDKSTGILQVELSFGGVVARLGKINAKALSILLDVEKLEYLAAHHGEEVKDGH